MKWIHVLLLVAICASVLGVQAQDAQPLQMVQSIKLQGFQGGMDYLSVDVKGNRLFVTGKGQHTLEIIDLKAGADIQSLKGVISPHGICFIPELNKLIVANGKANTVRFFDGTAISGIGSLSFEGSADNLRYEAATKRVYVAYGPNLGLIDPVAQKRIGDIKLEGGCEAFELEKSGKRIFANISELNYIAVLDNATRTLIAKWPLPDGVATNVPMALDQPNHRLFVATRAPGKMVVYNTDTGKVLASLDCAGGVDYMAYDPARKRIYVTCGDGYICVYQQVDADHYTTLAQMPMGVYGSETGLFVPELNRFYLAIPFLGAQQIGEIRVFEVKD